MIDEYFGYSLGHLEYRTVRFETEILDEENYQGNAVVNYTEREFLIQELLSISTLNTESTLKQLSQESILLSGNRELSRIIQSMTIKTEISSRSIASLQTKRAMLFSAEDLEITSIMTWIK